MLTRRDRLARRARSDARALAVGASRGRGRGRRLAVRVKVEPGRVKVEHDDAVRAAERLHMPLREVTSRAEEAWRREAHSHLTSVPPPDDDAG